MVSRMFLGQFASLLLCAGMLAASGCKDDEPKQEQKAVATDPMTVFDGGRDPFGAEVAAWRAHNGDSSDAAVDDDKDGCSNFSLTVVGPFQQVIGEQATFWGHAQDDQRHEFEFSWSASTGELTEKKGPTTKHTCSGAGLSTISMTASHKGVCTSAVAHVVTCLVPNM